MRISYCILKLEQMALITFIVFQGEVRINWKLAGQGEGEPLSIGKVILVHCCDGLDQLLWPDTV